MLTLIRRHHWIAALLIALSPAFAGVAMPVMHPCPVDWPQMGAAAHGPHDATATPGHESSHQGHQHGVCHCPGGCHLPQFLTPAIAAPVAAVTHTRPAASRWSVIERNGDAVPILEQLPEATAPPLA